MSQKANITNQLNTRHGNSIPKIIYTGLKVRILEGEISIHQTI
jgi:hypothetical protein